jgi:dCTP deaminase
MGTTAPTKMLPRGALGWPAPLLEALLQGLIDGDSSVRPERDCVWTASSRLVADVLLLCARVGRRAVARVRPGRHEGWLPSHVVSIARKNDGVSLPSGLLVGVRASTGLSQSDGVRLCGYDSGRVLSYMEGGHAAGVSIATLERVLDDYVIVARYQSTPLEQLTSIAQGDLLWDEVVEVVDTGRFEPVYDLEVRSRHARVENFVAGHGGVLASNTAGFIDASFSGHVTLEISNLANLPIALYPGMRIGQISFMEMTTPAERPYGPERGSKYSGQQLPTASRLYLDFLNARQDAQT